MLTSWAPFIGGAEVAVERLARGLLDVGHEVLLVVGTDGDAMVRFRAAGLHCEFVEQKFTGKLQWLQYRSSRNRLGEILQRVQPDIIHANDLPTHQMTSDAARRLGIPRVCHHRWLFEGGAIDWLNKFDAELHLFVSRALMDCLTDRSDELLRSPRSVVYDGLELPDVPTDHDRNVARQALGFGIDQRLVLFAGQIIERKGVADLLRAWASTTDKLSDNAVLAIIGDDIENDGEYRREMETFSNKLGVDAPFFGFQDNVDTWLTAADIVMVPSHAEPLGNATLEAMSYARPVIGTRVGGIPEMIRHDETGLLVEPHAPSQLAAAMRRLIQDHSLRKRLGDQARVECADRFSLATHVSNVIEQYQTVMNRCAVAQKP